MKKVSKKVRRRLAFLFPLTIFIVLVSIVSIGGSFYNIISLRREEQALKNELSNLKNEADEYSDEIVKLKDPDYIAKYARENYYYTKDGEYVIKINDEASEVISTSNDGNHKTYYILSFGVLILSVLIVFIKLKNKKKDI